MATEYESKVRGLLSTLGTSQAPWAKALLKTVQSKNISLSEWNTVLEKLAEASDNGDTLANAFLALPLEVLEQLEVVDTVGESETAVMSQKATTDAIAANRIKNVQDGQDLGIQQTPGSDIEDNTFSFVDKNPVATDIFNQLVSAGMLPPISLEEIPYGAVGDRSASFNSRSASFGKRSFTNGTSTIAIGEQSHAEGDSTVAFGDGSHTEGYYTTTVKEYSHAEGRSTLASGKGSHAEGDRTEASGESSHAEGARTKAMHAVSHVSGRGTVSSRDAQTVIGTYNEDAPEALFVVGNGNEDERSNAFTINDDGTATLGAPPKSDMDVATRGYVDDAVANAGGGSPIDIAQETGDSETTVMSQKAVSDELADHDQRISENYDSIDTLWNDQGWQNERHDELAERVTALESGGSGGGGSSGGWIDGYSANATEVYLTFSSSYGWYIQDAFVKRTDDYGQCVYFNAVHYPDEAGDDGMRDIDGFGGGYVYLYWGEEYAYSEDYAPGGFINGVHTRFNVTARVTAYKI